MRRIVPVRKRTKEPNLTKNGTAKWNRDRQKGGTFLSGYCAFRTMGKDELQAISRRAGVASGEARREKRRQIEEEKIRNRANIEAISEDIKALKQIYRGMTPEERERLHEHRRN